MRKAVIFVLAMVVTVVVSSMSFACPSKGENPKIVAKYETVCPYGDAVLIWINDKNLNESIVEESMCITYNAGKKAFMSFDFDWDKGKLIYPAKEYPTNQWKVFTMDGEMIPQSNGELKVLSEQDEIMQKEADIKVANMYDEHWK